MKTVLTLLATLVCCMYNPLLLYAQLIDSFTDSDLTVNPVWTGTVESWLVVRDSDVAEGADHCYSLRLNVGEAVAGTEYISSQITGSWGEGQTWAFWMGRRNQPATNANQGIVWLWASEPQLISSTVDGYRIRFGDNAGDDEIHLQRVDDGQTTDILLSEGAVPNRLTDIGFLVRVTRSEQGLWMLYTSSLPLEKSSGVPAGTLPTPEQTPVYQGQVLDASYSGFSDGYLGVMAVHSTSADARTGAEFDQFYFFPYRDQASAAPGSRTLHNSIPRKCRLLGNDPNPFNPDTTIHFEVKGPAARFITLDIFDLLGRPVRQLIHDILPPGKYRFLWNGTAKSGARVCSGLYFCLLKSDEGDSDVLKLILVD